MTAAHYTAVVARKIVERFHPAWLASAYKLRTVRYRATPLLTEGKTVAKLEELELRVIPDSHLAKYLAQLEKRIAHLEARISGETEVQK